MRFSHIMVYPHLWLASLTRILGRSNSTYSFWMCSFSRLSLSSDIDCLCVRFMVLSCALRNRGRGGVKAVDYEKLGLSDVSREVKGYGRVR